MKALPAKTPQQEGREHKRIFGNAAAGSMAADDWGNERGVGQFAVMGASPGVSSTATYLTASSIK